MASKKTVTRGKPDKRGYARSVLELSRDAKTEAATLLKRHQAGSITKVELYTGLKEVETGLKRIVHLINKII